MTRTQQKWIMTPANQTAELDRWLDVYAEQVGEPPAGSVKLPRCEA